MGTENWIVVKGCSTVVRGWLIISSDDSRQVWFEKKSEAERFLLKLTSIDKANWLVTEFECPTSNTVRYVVVSSGSEYNNFIFATKKAAEEFLEQLKKSEKK